MAEVVFVAITQGKEKYGAEHHVALVTTDSLEFAQFLQELLQNQPGGYRAKIKRAPTHGDMTE